MREKIVCFDPRDPSQSENDTATWKSTRNPALIAAHLSSPEAHRQSGFWEWVKQAADICDAPVKTSYAVVRADYGTAPQPAFATQIREIIDRVLNEDQCGCTG
jgi:hypothetical protein